MPVVVADKGNKTTDDCCGFYSSLKLVDVTERSYHFFVSHGSHHVSNFKIVVAQFLNDIEHPSLLCVKPRRRNNWYVIHFMYSLLCDSIPITYIPMMAIVVGNINLS